MPIHFIPKQTLILRNELADDIDALDLDKNLNNEVGQAGFATTQFVYEEVYLQASSERVLNRHCKNWPDSTKNVLIGDAL